MGLNTGGNTSQTTVQPAAGLEALSSPNSLYNLTPAEQTFQSGLMGASLPGSMANQAQSYTAPGGQFGSMFQLNPQAEASRQQGLQGMSLLTDPSMGLFGKYLDQMIAPQVRNNAIASGYGGASGASMEAMSRAGTNAAMQYGSQYPGFVNSAIQLGQLPQSMQLQGLTSLGLPLAQQDYQNLGTGLGAAGLQRQSSLADLSRIQQLLQSLSGKQITSSNAGPGLAASLLNLGSSALLGGSGGGTSLLGSLLGPAVSSAGGGLASLFGGGGGADLGTAIGSGLSGAGADILRGASDVIPEAANSGADILQAIMGMGGF
jgi:hypothetical protein